MCSTSLGNLCRECIEDLDDADLLRSKLRLWLDSSNYVRNALLVCLSEDRLDTCMSVLDEWTCVSVEVDRLLRIEEHCLAWIHLEDEVLERTEADHLEESVLLLL